jgi:hypothetical protein
MWVLVTSEKSWVVWCFESCANTVSEREHWAIEALTIGAVE